MEKHRFFQFLFFQRHPEYFKLADDFFSHIMRGFPADRILAEDLGTITPDVRDIMPKFGF